MSKKTTLFAITMVAAMPLAFAQAKPLRAEEITTPETSVSARAEIRKAELETKKTERQELLAQKKTALEQKRCEAAQKRISTKAGQLENNRAMYQRVYGNMDSRLTRLVARLDEAGLETAQLKTELATLKTMTAKLYADYDAFIATFKTTETAACEQTKEGFKAQFEGVRAQVALIRADRAAIKDFFNTNIKPELQALKAQLPEETAETTETEDAAKAVKTKAKVKVKQDDGSQTGTETDLSADEAGSETETETENEQEQD
ncbi:MAG TPA: hypothetical protein DCX32_02530 [Candidatus Moranbacteria bacterium]|nr:hypothetical protein [Candidatus Moranbacteria bacterium]